MTARAVMVLGTTSHAGKSWLATALCRWYARQGLKVAPFKAQNMSNNARVVPGPDGMGAEIGSAQYFQALAARRDPDVRMNPVLLKPERDTASQVIVLGRVRADLADVPWHRRSALLAPLALDALRTLQDENDIVIIEGAGSPAEINLQASDYVNLGAARASTATALLVADIDRGGAFAHLYGTHRLLPDDVRGQLRGFVLNRFRGDPALLAPGPAQLEALTGVPTLAVLPMWREHGLPEEDGVAVETVSRICAAGPVAHRIAIVAYPRISNLDEFQPLRQLRGVQLIWARRPQDLDSADLIILPGSKHTVADLAWLREHGLAAPIAAHAARGAPLLGVCGGLQMLGVSLHDPHGVDGGSATGLGLLPLETRFAADKLLARSEACFDSLDGAWRPWSGLAAGGYEIRHGRTAAQPDAPVQIALRNAHGEPIGWQRGNVLGAYLHGLFEAPALLETLFGETPRPLDAVFDGLADFIDQHFQPGALRRLIEPR
ncbi:cobyric acid synthase [Aquincola sp. S2]|uniref:Cobyric acid synthase n=1 Tax=Pseudaquabacterium terrae TaxID=2732868 RepID=A0ABX2EPP5_9BURK|nr:cobyric acid synthase [Aquabacterium terrae]NRF70464.1 cobyric acid synthase [Aquabacterium terrae]